MSQAATGPLMGRRRPRLHGLLAALCSLADGESVGAAIGGKMEATYAQR